jgi:nitroreductase
VTDLDVVTVDRLLTTTRAVRKRLDLGRAVPDEVIADCVRLPTQAPSAADAQNWRWMVVTDPAGRRAISDVHRAGSEDFVRGEVAELPEGAERRRMASALYMFEHLHEVPVHVLADAIDPDLEGVDGQQLPPALLYGSIFPAVWSFQLALRARGLGTTPLFGRMFITAAVVDQDWSPRTPLDRAQRRHMGRMRASVDELAGEHGVVHVVHPHAGTLVETADDITRSAACSAHSARTTCRSPTRSPPPSRRPATRAATSSSRTPPSPATSRPRGRAPSTTCC